MNQHPIFYSNPAMAARNKDIDPKNVHVPYSSIETTKILNAYRDI